MSITTIVIAAALALLFFMIIKKARGLSPEERQKIVDALERGATLVDVRTRQEYAGGHAKGAINIPLHELSKNVRTLERKPAPVIVYCASGTRSARAAKVLRRAGLETLDLGGRGNWADLGVRRG